MKLRKTHEGSRVVQGDVVHIVRIYVVDETFELDIGLALFYVRDKHRLVLGRRSGEHPQDRQQVRIDGHLKDYVVIEKIKIVDLHEVVEDLGITVGIGRRVDEPRLRHEFLKILIIEEFTYERDIEKVDEPGSFGITFDLVQDPRRYEKDITRV